MNVADAEDAVTEAVEHRDEAARLLARAESALFVAETNRDTARKHYAAMVAWVEQRERVLREITIATEGGYTP